HVFIQSFVLDLLLLTLGTMILPDPGVERVFIHAQVTSGLGNGLIRLHGQFHRAFLEFCGIFFRRGLTHRTHLVCCMMSLSPCVRKSIATSLETGWSRWSRDADVELSRDRGIAIAEFAPGAQVIAHKKVFTSAGLYVVSNRDKP